MIVHIVPQPCPSLCVLSRHAFEVDRGAIRENQPVPNDSDAVLRVGDLRIVGTDQARSLWDQKVVAGRCIVNILPDEGADLTGQVGVERLAPGPRGCPTRP